MSTPINLDDAALELEIRSAKERMIKARRPEIRAIHAECMAKLINLRSIEQVERMEYAKGLRS